VTNASFSFTFKKEKLRIYKYKMVSNIVGGCSPYNWAIEGSNDNKDFKTLSHVNEMMCGVSDRLSLPCTEEHEIKNHKAFQIIKFVGIGGECNGAYKYVGFSFIDFYVSVDIKECSCACKHYSNNIFTLGVFLIAELL